MKYLCYTFLSFLFVLVSCAEKKEEPKNNNAFVKPDIKDFLFVGIIDDKAGLYKYSFYQKTYEEYWTNKKEEVIKLSYSKEMKNVFFITAKNFDQTGAYPNINNIKLYLVNSETDNPDFVEEIGNGLQVFSQWEGENNFRIIINSFDKTIVNYVYHRKILYNIFGKKLEDFTETFDITKQGYPFPSVEKINYSSPGSKYFLINNSDSKTIYLKHNNAKELIIEAHQNIKQIEWAEELLFISTIKINQDSLANPDEKIGSSKLIVYSLEKKKILMKREGEGLKNYFITNEYLVFDNGFVRDSYINIFNIKTLQLQTEIRIDNGCGLKNIPQTSDDGI